MASCTPAYLLALFRASVSQPYAVATAEGVRACTVSGISQWSWGILCALIWSVYQFIVQGISSGPSWTPTTAVQLVLRPWGLPHPGTCAALLFALLSTYLWASLQMSRRSNAQMAQEIARLKAANRLLRGGSTQQREGTQEPLQQVSGEEQVQQALQTAAAAAQLGLSVAMSAAIAPFVKFASTLPANNVILSMVLAHGAQMASQAATTVSGIYSLPVFLGFGKISGADPDAQAGAQRLAAALLVVMLRRLAGSQALRNEVRAALLPEFGALKPGTKWSTLNDRLYRKWNQREFGALLERVAGAELQYVKHKHTRVAAMQMLALLMQHGYMQS